MSIDRILDRMDERGVTRQRALRVFLSSTGDLCEYRKVVGDGMERVDKFQCIRMEDFAASYQTVAEHCRERVQDCDIFVCLVGDRYGSVSDDEADGRSYTLIEYDAARDANIPVLAYVAPPGTVPVDPNRGPESEESADLQREFRRRLANEQTPGKDQRWNTPAELTVDVVAALSQAREDLLLKLDSRRQMRADGTDTAIWTGRPDPATGQGGGIAVASPDGTPPPTIDETALRSVLADAYPDFDSQRVIAEDAGIDAEAVNLQGNALTSWANILREMRACERLPALLECLRKDENPKGVALLETYIEAAKHADKVPKQRSSFAEFLRDGNGSVAVGKPGISSTKKLPLVPIALCVAALAIGGTALSGGFCGMVGFGCPVVVTPQPPLPTLADLGTAIDTYALPAEGTLEFDAATGALTFATPPTGTSPFTLRIALPAALRDRVAIAADTPAQNGATKTHCLEASAGTLALDSPLKGGERVRFTLSISPDEAARAACTTVLPYWKPVTGAKPAGNGVRALAAPDIEAPLRTKLSLWFPSGTTAYIDPAGDWVRILRPNEEPAYIKASEVKIPAGQGQ